VTVRAGGDEGIEVGAELELEIGQVAHGGHCVARHRGQVVFVRHALPGELVVAEVTSRTSRFLRADAVRVLRAAPGRVEPPCALARPGGCGGCDWQHADVVTQRDLKTAVVREQLDRLGGVVVDVEVEEVPGTPDGLGWRTRERFTVDPETSRLGLHRHRSPEVQPLDTCPIASPLVLGTGVLERSWAGSRSVAVAASATTGDTAVVVDDVPRGRRRVRERAAGREWKVDASGFWQVHPAAPEVLVEAVRAAAAVRPADQALDLYSGVGLFAAVLAEGVGPAGRVDAVESSATAVRDARRNLHDLPVVRLRHGDVEGWLVDEASETYDVVVLDPPRSGAGREILGHLARRTARRIVYVACDPAALARDVRTLAELGWGLGGLRAFDLFPMTHHVECVAWFTPVARAAAS
jgi:tRNA/tmRNA/rRNA uracil-C5-methylase (TrmA/RlmC/RlmD family)